MRLHSVQTLGTKEIVSSQEDNYVYLLLWSAKTLQYALLRTPSNNICTIICFQLCPLCFVFYGPSLLSNMSGRKHLRCSLGLFAPTSSNHLAKLWHRNSPQIGPFLGQSSLFVCLPPSYPDQCWPFIGILWQAEKNWFTQSRSQSFFHTCSIKQLKSVDESKAE